jgi:hypothetical protein
MKKLWYPKTERWKKHSHQEGVQILEKGRIEQKRITFLEKGKIGRVNHGRFTD